MYRKVLVPLDGSQLPQAAFAFLQQELASAEELILLQVIPPTPSRVWEVKYCSPASWMYFTALDYQEMERSRALSHLEGALRLLGADERWRCRVAVGECVAQTVVDFARAEEVDLITLCGGDAQGLSQLLCGCLPADEELFPPVAVEVFSPRELSIARIAV